MLLPSFTQDKKEAGCDEAGRGCLAGPVFAAAVILDKSYSHPLLRDSKMLSYEQRDHLYDEICRDALAYSVSKVSPLKIDRINILNASILAMHKSLSSLEMTPEFILVDGNRFKPFKKIPFECVIKGDNKFYSIAAASVLAKVSRDRYMEKMAKKFPLYGWERNKGYPTREHREGIMNFGPCPLHRQSFRLIPEMPQLELFG